MTSQIQKVEKTLASIRAYQRRGGTANAQRGRDLIARYDAECRAITGVEGHSDAWKAYCQAHDFCPTHTAWDLFC